MRDRQLARVPGGCGRAKVLSCQSDLSVVALRGLAEVDLSPGLLLRGTRNDRRVRLPQLVTAGLRVGGKERDGVASSAPLCR